jgi:hypothetical protein
MMFHIPALFKAPFPVSEWLVRLLSGLSAAQIFPQGNKKRSSVSAGCVSHKFSDRH